MRRISFFVCTAMVLMAGWVHAQTISVSLPETYQVVEGNDGAFLHRIPVTLDWLPSEEVTVSYFFESGTAIEGIHFGQPADKRGPILFKVGERLQYIFFETYGDVADNPDRTFAIHLENPVNAVLDQGHCEVTIVDDEAVEEDPLTCTPVRAARSPYATVNEPHLICSPQQLINLADRREDWTKQFVLGSDLNLSGQTVPSIGRPLAVTLQGLVGPFFSGTFDGRNYRIRSFRAQVTFSSDRHDSYPIGLFSMVTGGAIRNLKLEDAQVMTQYADEVGGLVGRMEGGRLENVEVINPWVQADDDSFYVGGIFGRMTGTLADVVNARVYGAFGQVRGGSSVGGLGGRIGHAQATETPGLHLQSSSSGVRVVGAGNFVGGLLGASTGMVSNSSATGTVSAGGYGVGGLVGGLDGGDIYRSCAAGGVSGESSVGGLIGKSLSLGEVAESFSSGTVSGGDYVGGLIGDIFDTSIHDAFSTSAVQSSGLFVGGLVGVHSMWDAQSVRIQNTYAIGSVQGSVFVGGLVGSLEAVSLQGSFALNTTLTGDGEIGGLVAANAGGAVQSSCHTKPTADNGEGVVRSTPAECVNYVLANAVPAWDLNTVWIRPTGDLVPRLRQVSGCPTPPLPASGGTASGSGKESTKPQRSATIRDDSASWLQ